MWAAAAVAEQAAADAQQLTAGAAPVAATAASAVVVAHRVLVADCDGAAAEQAAETATNVVAVVLLEVEKPLH